MESPKDNRRKKTAQRLSKQKSGVFLEMEGLREEEGSPEPHGGKWNDSGWFLVGAGKKRQLSCGRTALYVQPWQEIKSEVERKEKHHASPLFPPSKYQASCSH